MEKLFGSAWEAIVILHRVNSCGVEREQSSSLCGVSRGSGLGITVDIVGKFSGIWKISGLDGTSVIASEVRVECRYC